MQKFKDDAVAPTPVADPDLLEHKEIIKEMATGGQTMLDYVQKRWEDEKLQSKELKDYLYKIMNRLHAMTNTQIVPAAPEEPALSKYKEVIEKLADSAIPNMSDYLGERLKETALQPESLKDLKSILQN